MTASGVMKSLFPMIKNKSVPPVLKCTSKHQILYNVWGALQNRRFVLPSGPSSTQSFHNPLIAIKCVSIVKFKKR